MTLVLLFARFAGAVFGAILGASLASFGCVVGERLPRGESIGGRSHCACGRQLRAWENVPVLAWLVLRGRTRCCGVRLPVRYLLAEAGLGVWGAVCGQVVWAQAASAGPASGWWLLGAVLGIAAGFVVVVEVTRRRG